MSPYQITGPAVLCIGNPFDGMRLVGPFEDMEAAVHWAETTPQPIGDEWHAVPLEEP